jgi:hypothetical protein
MGLKCLLLGNCFPAIWTRVLSKGRLPRSRIDPHLLTSKVRQSRSLSGVESTLDHKGLIIAPRCSQKALSDRITNYSRTHVQKQPPTFAAEYSRVSMIERRRSNPPPDHLPSLKDTDIAQDPIVVIDEWPQMAFRTVLIISLL